MNRADEIIPWMARGEVPNPVFAAGQIIHFEREADGQLREILLRLADFPDVFVQLIGAHPPIVEIVARHRRVVGKANFIESKFKRAFCIFARLTGCVAAERRVHVVIGGQRHAVSFKFQVSSFKC